MNIVVVIGVVVTLLTLIPVVMQLRAHPKGIAILFFAEMWERFAFYGMRSLLIFFLTDHFLFQDDRSQELYAAYMTMAYLTPLLGGYLADWYLGARKAVILGAVLLAVGHFGMTIEGAPATQTLTYQGRDFPIETQGRMDGRTACLRVAEGCRRISGGDARLNVDVRPGDGLPSVLATGTYQVVDHRDDRFLNIFYFALALVIMGVGFLKPNMSALVGQLYPQGDPRRDAGFTLYYYGINLGSFWAAILCGLLGKTVGWWAGFGLAGVGMLGGLAVFLRGAPLLAGAGAPPDPERLKRKAIGPVSVEMGLYAIALLSVVGVWVLIRFYALMGWVLVVGWVLALGYVGYQMVGRSTREARSRMILALVLIAASVMFFALFEQAGSSMNQFAARNTILPNRGFVAVAPAQVQSFNAGFILILATVFSALWAWLARRGRDPNPVLKFGLAMVQLGLGFFLLVWGAQFHDPAYRVPLIFLAGAYFLHTTAELCLSPVGLSEMTKLAPRNMASMMLAIWFLAYSAALYLSSLIAKLTSTETVGGQVLDPATALATYTRTFAQIGAFGVAAGIVLLAASPWLKRLARPAPAAAPEAPAPSTVQL